MAVVGVHAGHYIYHLVVEGALRPLLLALQFLFLLFLLFCHLTHTGKVLGNLFHNVDFLIFATTCLLLLFLSGRRVRRACAFFIFPDGCGQVRLTGILCFIHILQPPGLIVALILNYLRAA